MSNQGLKVAHKRCDQCLFGPNKIVSESRKRSILRDCDRDQTHFLCHKGTLRGDEVVCAGFAEAQKRGEHYSKVLAFALYLGATERIDAETGESVDAEVSP